MDALKVFEKQFPPPEEMEPNVLIIVKLPLEIMAECEGNLSEFKQAVFAIAEQELNIISISNVKVQVIIEGVKPSEIREGMR